jgi:uncharacterized membrane protein YhiD involved in acid resistance
MDFGIFLLAFIALIVIVIVSNMADNYMRWLREKERYIISLQNLENQLQTGNITEKTYKELRMDLEEKHYKSK